MSVNRRGAVHPTGGGGVTAPRKSKTAELVMNRGGTCRDCRGCATVGESQTAMRNNNCFDAGKTPQIEPSVFLTNLPGIVGFYPRGQVVIAALYDRAAAGSEGGTIELEPARIAGPMLIKDLRAMESKPELVSEAADFLLDEGCGQVDIFIIDESWGVERDSTPIVEWLHDGGIEEIRLAGVARIAAGEVITDHRGEIVGIVGDSLLTETASLISEHGEKIFSTYAEYCNSFLGNQFRDEADRKLIETFRERAIATDGPRHLRVGSDNAALIEHFNRLRGTVERVACGDTDAAAAVRDAVGGYAIAMALTNLALRDMSITLITSSQSKAIGEIWREAASVHRGKLRANALACFAIAKFAEGLDNYAYTALKEADREEPGHSLTRLLEIAAANRLVSKCVSTVLGASDEVVRRVYKVRAPRLE